MDQSRSEFEEFAISNTPALLRSAYLLTGDQHLAEDLVQSALAKTHRMWRRLDRAGNATAYTRKIMYHLQVSWWRKRRVRENFGERPVDRSVPDPTGDVDLKLSLHRALLSLTARQRAVIVLRYFEDRSVADTAAVLGCSEGTVKTLAFRSLNRLRTVLPSLADLVHGGE